MVFIIGFEEGLIPHEYDGQTDIVEETRLAFVGMSRAKDQLVLTFAKKRTRFKPVETEPSRYLRALGNFALFSYFH